jgi:hypothetical protein
VEEIQTLVDLLGRVEFITGLVTGSVAVALLAGAIPRERLRPWGLAVGLATLATIHSTIGRRLGFTLAIALVAIGGWLISERTSQESKRSPVGWVLIVAGAFLAVSRGDIPEMWIQVGGVLAIMVAGSIMSRWSSLNQYLVGPLFLITAFGIWSTVPETNAARGLLGLAIPLAFATLKPIGARLTTVGAYAVATVVIWIGATGGVSRPASVIGAWASLGLLVILPLVGARLQTAPRWPVLVGHGVMVLISARVIGLGVAGSIALPAAMALHGFALAVAFLVTSPQNKRHP